jgi:4-amino-4-deoxy-L-arabinose transferase-like glycosyltransferase
MRLTTGEGGAGRGGQSGRAGSISRLSPALVFAAALVALFTLRGAALTTPYFWDEAGYYVPAAVSMYRNSLYPIPDLTIAQSYPPLVPLTLALAWMAAGFSIVVTRVVVFVFAAATLAYTYMLGRALWSGTVGLAAAAITLVIPTFFAQAGLAQPEVPLALFTVAATYYLYREEPARHGLAVALLVMTKWTAIISIPVFALHGLTRAGSWRAVLRHQLRYAPALALLGAWFAFFYYQVGTLTSPDARYAKVNLWDNLVPAALAWRAPVRLWQLFVEDFRQLLLLPMLAAFVVWGVRWALGARAEPGEAARSRRSCVAVMLGLCAIYVGFLTASGFLLARYFVPVFPLLSLLGAASVFWLLPRPAAAAYVTGVAVVMHLTWLGRFDNSPPGALEERPVYMDFAAAHLQAARFVEEHYPGARVAATWPTRDELTHPFLGYVSRRHETVLLQNVEGATVDPASFDLLLEAPVPRNRNWIRPQVERLGLIEVTRFDVNGQQVVVWGKR